MNLHRENILTLIGSRRYHSCILTTFSFDFYFFEMKVMKWMRSCGVRNINVLIDGHYYSELMKQSTGEEMQLTPGYSLYPIFQNKIFHPKLWMLFGKNEGLLLVGSGNLTNSGNGNNEEIWAAFHFDVRFPENSQVFSVAWDYLSAVSSTTLGQTNDKTTKWIIDQSQWLNELPKTDRYQFCRTAQDEEIALLYNSETTTIWGRLKEVLKDQNVIEITTISPFYDINGTAISEMKVLFPQSKMNIVIDENGLVPSSLKASENYMFYDWYDVGVSKNQYSRSEDVKSKLHAKIIHFITAEGIEYCLLGSANVTSAGLGITGVEKSNSEVSILIKSGEGGFLNILGIKLSGDKIKRISDFSLQNSRFGYDTILENNRFIINLLAAEYLYRELIIYSRGSWSQQLQVVFFDRNNTIIRSSIIQKYEPEIKLKLDPDLTGFQYVQLADIDGTYLSNKLLLTDYFLLAKTHPNPQTEEIERIYSEIQSGELSKVLDLLNYAMIDETENEDGLNIIQAGGSKKRNQEEKKEPDKLYDLSAYKPIFDANYEKALLFSSPTLRVLDVLRFIQTKGISSGKTNDIRDDEQENDLGNINGNEANDIKIVHYQSHYMLSSERRKLLNYFSNLSRYQHDILYGKTRGTPYKPTLTDLTRYLIFIELIHEYGGKTEKYVEHDQQHFFTYIPFTENYDNDNVKGCCLNIIGEFLLLVRLGYKEYEFEYTKLKVEQLGHDALINTIVCLLNNNWSEKEMHYFYTLTLNAMHYLGWKDAVNNTEKYHVFKAGLKNRIRELKHRASSLHENIARFNRDICPVFHKVILRVTNKKFDLHATEGNIIYKSPWGYCFIKSVAAPNRYTLVRPGFLWDTEQKDYIKIRPTEEYIPLELPSFIVVDI